MGKEVFIDCVGTTADNVLLNIGGKNMYRYETHLHTSPVSRCAQATVEDSLQFYKSIGYDGVFITNHFIDGNINIDQSKSYAEKIQFYCSD